MNGETPEGERWHVARFRFNSAPGAPPEWHLDLIVAHFVVAPLLEAIGLWRLHRRYHSADEIGHQFSFCFYARPPIGAPIMDSIERSVFVAQLRQLGKLTETHFEREGGNELAWGTDNWEAPIKNAWPYFIHGVSKTLLDLLRQELAGEQFTKIDVATLKRFEEAHLRISQLWQKDGWHAMLHHLNAIFAYEPVLAASHYALPMQF